MCKHPLGSGRPENGSDCCRVLGESASDIFVVQNVSMQNLDSAVRFPLFRALNQSRFTHWRCASKMPVLNSRALP
jgi:hypothetical protein